MAFIIIIFYMTFNVGELCVQIKGDVLDKLNTKGMLLCVGM